MFMCYYYWLLDFWFFIKKKIFKINMVDIFISLKYWKRNFEE